MSLPDTRSSLPMPGQPLVLPSGFAPTRWFLRRLLSRIAIGQLTVVTPDGERLTGPAGLPGPQAVMILKSWRALRRLMLDGDIGLAEAYRDGDVETPDLTALIELGARNDATLRKLVSGLWPARLLNRARHLLNSNTRAGSRRNITAHYDLGNAFYTQWLDTSMMYSSALYATPAETLEVAQQRRLDRIVAMLDLSGGEHLLEIGCGWGALAERLAREGCRVTAITLSPAQLEATQQRVARAGLTERVTIELRDYRDIAGEFDRIVSIEMIETLGAPTGPHISRRCAARCAPAGAPCCRRSPSMKPCSRATSRARTSSSATSSQAAACHRCRRSGAAPATSGSRLPTSSISARATP